MSAGGFIADPWSDPTPAPAPQSAPAADPNAAAVQVGGIHPATPEELAAPSETVQAPSAPAAPTEQMPPWSDLLHPTRNPLMATILAGQPAPEPEPASPGAASAAAQDPNAPVADPWGGQDAAPAATAQGPLKSDEGLGFMAGLDKPLDNAATWLEKIPGVRQADQAVAGFLGVPSTDQAIAGRQTALDAAAAQGRKPGALGQFAGSVVGTAPLGMVTTNPFALGALSGAAMTSDPNNLGATAASAGIGAAGGKLGDVAMRGLGSIVAPRLSDAARTLMSKGVTLTPGQILGGTAKRMEDAASSIPLVGDFIKNAQANGLTGFNRATVQQALDPIGEKLPDDVATGHDAIAYAQGKMSDAYGRALKGVTVSPDAEYAMDLHGIRKDTNVLAPDDQDHVNRIIDNLVMPRFSYGQAMSGDAMKALDSKLGTIARQYPGPVADNVRAVQGAVRAAVARQNPAQAPALNAANAGYAQLVRAETAAASQNAGKNGLFTAPQYMGAVKRGDSSIRDRAFARGDALGQDWAAAGSHVLPSSVPDSGTANRGMIGALLLGGGHAAHMLVNPATGIPIAGLTAAYTKGGQSALRAAIMSRPAWAPQARGLLSNFVTPAGILGAQAAQPLTQGLLPSPAP